MFENKIVDWIPVDVAAATITDVLLSSHSSGTGQPEEENKYSVHNIVNPNSIEWGELVEMLQACRQASGSGGRMEEVLMTEWVSRLSTISSSVTPDELPALKLLHFFENMAETREEESRFFETGKSRGISGALRECRPFCREWVGKNLKVWKGSGFLA